MDEGKEIITRRGDSFDIGNIVTTPQEKDIITRALQNPEQLAEMLNLDEAQARNVKSIITGAGAGLSSKFLSSTFGDEIAGAFGGFLGAYVARRLIGK